MKDKNWEFPDHPVAADGYAQRDPNRYGAKALRILKLLIARDGSTNTDGKMLDNIARSAMEFRQYDFDCV
jgi:hypothetical protein